MPNLKVIEACIKYAAGQQSLQSAPAPDCHGQMAGERWIRGIRNPDRKATEEGGVVFLGMELGNCRMASMAKGKDAPAGLDHKDLG